VSFATVKGSDLTSTSSTGVDTEALSDGSVGALTQYVTANPAKDIVIIDGTGFAAITISVLQITRGTHAHVAATEITSGALATRALDILDKRIEGVNSTRATLGASMSRLEYAADNLQNVSQNSSAARSRVLDADYASETTELARTQIIQQASTAMLSQANQAQQSVLSLLK
jgi:flagellin